LKKAIIMDIDGTLADNGHRKELAIQRRWAEFTSQSGADEAFPWALAIVEMALGKGWAVIFMTGRSDRFASLTALWLQEKAGVRVDGTDTILLMRSEGDNREDTVIKAELFETEVEGKFDVQFAVDDRTRIIKMWREKGLTALQCADGDF